MTNLATDPIDRRRLVPLVVKVGGSLLAGERLAGVVATLARARRPLVVVPGGGAFADQVRQIQARHEISDRAAHQMALLAMHQMGLLLQDMQPRLAAVDTLAAIRQAQAANLVPVWLPLRLAASDETIPADWSVTSDALAARLAERLRYEAVLLIKSRSVPHGPSAEELAGYGIVDPVFGEVVERASLAFRIIGPGDERTLAEICLSAPAMRNTFVKDRRQPGRPERTRRVVRRAAGGLNTNVRQ
ncbi:MAG: uridylate kinase [Hyphomicrobiaceae bacterium]